MSTDVLSSLVEHPEDSRPTGFTVTRVNLSGDNEVNAIADAVIEAYPKTFDTPDSNDLEALAASGKPVTILRGGRGAFGHSYLDADEGRLFASTSQSGGLALLPKGKRTKGYRINSHDSARLLDVMVGYNQQQVLIDRVAQIKNTLPTLVALSQEDFRALPSRGSICSLAVFGTHRLLDGAVPGSIWLLHTYLRSDDADICEGYLFVPPDSGWFSEHGSIFGRELLARNVGKVDGFAGIPFSDVVKMTYEQALEAIRS